MKRAIRLDEITATMLIPARMAADRAQLPMTVWPSRNFGRDFFGADLLVTFAAAGGKPPGDAESMICAPFFTVLPSNYFGALRNPWDVK